MSATAHFSALGSFPDFKPRFVGDVERRCKPLLHVENIDSQMKKQVSSVERRPPVENP